MGMDLELEWEEPGWQRMMDSLPRGSVIPAERFFAMLGAVTITWMNGILKIGGLSTGLRQRNLLIIWSSISYVTQDFVQSKSLIILKTC